MTRSGITPLLAAVPLLAVGIAVPYWAIGRFGGPLLPVRASDLLLLIAILGWVTVVKAFVERNEPVDSLTNGPGTPIWFAHRLVDESLIGVGILRRQPVAPASLATTIVLPRDLAPSELPSERPPWFDHAHDLAAEDAPRKTMPTLDVVEPEGPAIDETEVYLVGRGDTWWSIAEETLGDGRDWNALLELNLDREVAPGHTLTHGDELRIGWSILVPLVSSSNEEEDNVG